MSVPLPARCGGSQARENHYRKTPEFAELMMWEIPEESTRVANFQAGRLDSFQMAFDSKGAMDQVEGIRYIAVPNGATEHLGFYGNWYVGHGEADFAERRPGLRPRLALGIRQPGRELS